MSIFDDNRPAEKVAGAVREFQNNMARALAYELCSVVVLCVLRCAHKPEREDENCVGD